MRQIESHEMRLLLHAGDHHLGLAEVGLRLARRVCERDEHLLAAELGLAHVVLHDGVAAGVIVFGPEPLDDALGRVPLLLRTLLVHFEDGVDRPLPRPQLRPPDRLLPPIARR